MGRISRRSRGHKIDKAEVTHTGERYLVQKSAQRSKFEENYSINQGWAMARVTNTLRNDGIYKSKVKI